MSGRLADAPALLEMLKSSAPVQFRCEGLRLLGEVYRAMDQLSEARAFPARALDLARDGGVRRVEARALLILGNVALLGEPADVEAGEANYRVALTLAEELGMRPLVAHCHLGLGKLYWRAGKREHAHEHLITAVTMYREMDMRFWLEQAEPELRALE